MEFIEASGIKLLPWMPKGCDISPIENVWAWIEDRMFDRVNEIKNR